MTTSVYCPECDHGHKVTVIRGETPFEDYAETPEYCEACGAPFETLGGYDDRRTERQQMGITG